MSLFNSQFFILFAIYQLLIYPHQKTKQFKVDLQKYTKYVINVCVRTSA